MNTTRIANKKKRTNVVIYIVSIILAILSIMPFWIMIVNATRSTFQVQQHAVSLIPSHYLLSNLEVLTGKTFNPTTGFLNSLIISTGSTLLAIYFSTLTAYALVAYNWKLRSAFFTLILAVLSVSRKSITVASYGS